jgi:isoleucyl-tRNA synthetase
MGLMLDEQGKKMSKSVGNVINPDEAIALCGVDAIRWFIYTVNSPGETKMFNFKEIQNSFRQTLLLCWNVFNYFVTYSSVNNFVTPSEADIQVLVSQKASLASLAVLDRWILSRQAVIIQQVTNYLDSYDFMRAGRTLAEYINDLSTWYLRRSRKRSDSEFFTILYSVLLNLSKMMAPLAPFMSEKIFQVLRTNDLPQSVHLCVWPKNTEGPDKELELQMRQIRQAVELGFSVRAAQQLKVRQPLGKAYLRSETSFSPELMPILAEELNVLEIELVSSIDEGIPQKEIEGMAVGLDTRLTDQLIIAGQARELLRHIQQLRKERGLRPGQIVTLRVDPAQKAFAQALLEAHPDILKNSYVKVVKYTSQASVEVTIDNQSILIDLVS